MTSKEKVDLLISYEDKQELTNNQFKKLLKFSNDNNAFVRSIVAELLINFKNKRSKKKLLKLSCDKKAIVRTNAYDSLRIFESKDVEKFLKKVIQKERNKIACAYAIMSWADIAVALDVDTSKKRLFVKKIKKLHKIQKSEQCILSCCYAQYILGRKKSLKEIIDFLKSKDYRVRCAAINTLWEIIEYDNYEIIKESLRELIEKEDTIAVKSNAMKLRQFIDNGNFC